ncbi:MAG: tetratricopeptide repeat protein [Candidatus Levyibacteriota bacterium]
MTLKTQAIQTALNGDWEKAVVLNKQLIKEDPKDIEALNRLAFAYNVLGKTKDAKETYQKVLKIDDQNLIALKNIRRLPGKNKSKNEKSKNSHCFLGGVNSMFIEETGRTKVVELINLADPKTIAGLMIGEAIELGVKRLKIFAFDQRKQYLGMLPDNIGKRLVKFIKGGNKYQAFVKAADGHRISVFIKEVSRTNRFKNQQSFSSSLEKTKNVISSKYYEQLKETKESEDSQSE